MERHTREWMRRFAKAADEEGASQGRAVDPRAEARASFPALLDALSDTAAE